MDILDSTKSLLENLNFLSGPIIALFGLVALVQIRLAKKAIVINSKRQAAGLATKQIEIYSNQIIPMQNEIYEIDMKEKITRIKCPSNLQKFTIEELKKTVTEEEIANNFDYMITNLNKVNAVLNAMNTFATYFTKGVADEEIAFSAIGLTYCYSVEKYCYEICGVRSEDGTEIYNNLIELYNIWNPRLKREKLSRELERKKDEMKNIKVNKIDILGAK